MIFPMAKIKDVLLLQVLVQMQMSSALVLVYNVIIIILIQDLAPQIHSQIIVLLVNTKEFMVVLNVMG
jgi:hypothetical protein